ncbi:MAG: class I SAM-dependent methyltransferase [Clostridia bacterium]|nr:class I SAM-dependent methyltransferase [Clostridia bacterium]
MNNVESYDKIVDKWEENRRNRGIDPIIVSFSEMLPENSKILDIGCGTGYPTDSYLVECGHTVVGVDPSVKMIEKAKSLRLKNAAFYEFGLFEYESGDKFDAVIAFDSLFHPEFEKQKDIYAKVGELLKKGGLFLFTHGIKAGSITGEMFGENFYYSALDKAELLICLKNANFEILR